MNFQRKTVTVAIADADHDRRAGYERILQGEPGIKLLTNVTVSNQPGSGLPFINRRLKPRLNLTATEDEVARIKRLKPLVLLINLNQCTEQDSTLLLSLRHECPDAQLIFIADDNLDEEKILKVLEIGARGYLKYETVRMQLSKAIQVVGQGETWVPRKMLGTIMEHILN